MLFPKITILLNQGRFLEAEKEVRAELQESIEDPFLFYLLSITLVFQDKPKKAEAAANQAVKIEPEFDLGYLALSRALHAQKKFGAANDAIEQAILISPEDPDLFAQKAQILLDADKKHKALEAAETGLSLDADNEDCRFFYSVLLERLGRHEEAETQSMLLLAENPLADENHCARGWVLAQRGEARKAELHFAEALKINPDSADAREGMAFAFQMKNPFLGWILKTLIWMEKIPIWIFIIGILVVMRIAHAMAAPSNPFPIPLIGNGIRVGFWGFFILALLLQPIFNLILNSSKTSRYALTTAHQKGAKWLLIPVLLALGYLVFWAVFGPLYLIPVHAVAWAAVACVFHQAFSLSNQWVKNWVFGIGLIVLGGALWIEYYMYGIYRPTQIPITEKMEAFRIAHPTFEKIDDLSEIDQTHFKSLVNQFVENSKRHSYFVRYPALALWLIGSFIDDIANLIQRKAPDA